MRIKKWLCRHLGHREKKDEWSTWCGRCLVLIAGPLNGGGTRVTDPVIPPEQEG